MTACRTDALSAVSTADLLKVQYLLRNSLLVLFVAMLVERGIRHLDPFFECLPARERRSSVIDLLIGLGLDLAPAPSEAHLPAESKARWRCKAD